MRRLAAAGLVVALAVLVACSGDDDDADDAAASSAADTATTDAATPVSSSPPPATTVTPSTAAPTSAAPPTTAAVTSPPTSAPAGGTTTAPEGDAFWVPPDPLPPGEPGDVIWRRPIDTAQGPAELVLYRSTDVHGEPVAVSGLMYVPDDLPPGGDVPVLAIAHGTTGIADDCAPSRLAVGGGSWELTAVPALLDQGWIVMATDYEGLGTPGTHTYLVSEAEARAVLDSVRAAERLDVGAGPASPVVVFGHSQGGGASAATADVAPSYAPELDVRGAVAGAPATELADLGRVELSGPLIGFGMMIIAGYAAAYPDLDVAAMLSPTGEVELGRVDEGCVGEVLSDFAASDTSGWAQPVDTPGRDAWQAALDANTPGGAPTEVPVYVFHGEADSTVPAAWSAAYQARACAAGTDVTRVTYPGADHVSVVLDPPAVDDALAWAADRVAGIPAPPGCPS